MDTLTSLKDLRHSTHMFVKTPGLAIAVAPQSSADRAPAWGSLA
jgi:hypothetical protein